MPNLVVKKDGRWQVVRADGSVKSGHESEEKATKSISYAKKHYEPKGRGKICTKDGMGRAS